MEPFDVLNMGNISYFHLKHSNCYLFYLFKFRDPFISPKRNSSDYRVYGTQNDGFNAKIGFEKYAPSPKISVKKCQILLV